MASEPTENPPTGGSLADRVSTPADAAQPNGTKSPPHHYTPPTSSKLAAKHLILLR